MAATDHFVWEQRKIKFFFNLRINDNIKVNINLRKCASSDTKLLVCSLIILSF